MAQFYLSQRLAEGKVVVYGPRQQILRAHRSSSENIFATTSVAASALLVPAGSEATNTN